MIVAAELPPEPALSAYLRHEIAWTRSSSALLCKHVLSVNEAPIFERRDRPQVPMMEVIRSLLLRYRLATGLGISEKMARFQGEKLGGEP